MGFFKQYMGLRKEMYILFWGRVVTNMGALVWPMMTLILKNKLGYSASEVAIIMMVLGFVQLPCMVLGGKMADRFNKRNLIILCDLVTVATYFLCYFLPVDRKMIPLLTIAAIFALMEWPSYDALVADLSSSKDRDNAYSLNYLGTNLGLVLSPILGGFLFADHLNLAFLISSIATLSSTVLIFLFIKDVTPVQEESEASRYEKGQHSDSIWKVLRQNPLLYLFLICGGLWSLVYSQFNFLLPLNLEQLYSAQGAVLFGTLTSVNAIVVIVGTPLMTKWVSKMQDVTKLMFGQVLIIAGYSFFVWGQNLLGLYYVAMVIFTLGEIVHTIGQQPYLTRRIPASHRGRLSSFSTIFAGVFQLTGQQAVGRMADTLAMSRVWFSIICIGAVNIFGYFLLRKCDRKVYPLLYAKQ